MMNFPDYWHYCLVRGVNPRIVEAYYLKEVLQPGAVLTLEDVPHIDVKDYSEISIGPKVIFRGTGSITNWLAKIEYGGLEYYMPANSFYEYFDWLSGVYEEKFAEIGAYYEQ